MDQAGTGKPPSAVAVDSADARALFARAVAHHRRGELAAAVALYSRIAATGPDWPDLYNNLGVALRATGRLDAAVVCYRRALALGAHGAGILSNLGNALRALDRFDEAAKAHSQAVGAAPESPSAIYNLGLALRDLGHVDDSLACFNRALAADPDNPDYLWDRALSLLQRGDYEQGFRDYATRWRLKRNPPRPMERPRWDGRRAADRTLLLYREQGFGDMIQFIRYAPLAAERFGGRVVIEAPRPLVRLFAASLPDLEVTDADEPLPPHDVCLPLLDLPGLMGTSLETVPAEVQYLRPPPGMERTIPAPPDTRLKVGLVWGGKARPRDRSCPLAKLLRLAEIPGVRLYSLQVDGHAGDIAALGAGPLIEDLAGGIGDFADTAAAMAGLDLIVTIDSAPAHLAGAMGRPSWTLLLHSADWRWLTGCADSPWYPTMRLFRQPRPGDWDSVIDAVMAALAETTAT